MTITEQTVHHAQKRGIFVKKWLVSKAAKKITVIILILFVVLIVQIIGFLHFNKNLYDMSLEHSVQQVEELSLNIENNLYLELDHDVHILDLIESQLEKEDTFLSEGMISKLQQVYDVSDFKLMGISDLDGRGVDSTGRSYNISYTNIREHIENDELYISNVLKSGDETLIFIAIPLKLNGEISGILWCKHALVDLVNNIDFMDDSYRYFQIIDDQGRYLFSSKSKFALHGSTDTKQTIWEEMEDYTYPAGTSAFKIYENVQNRGSGNFYFESNGQGRYVSYRPLSINNWYLFSVQVDDGLHEYVHHTRHLAVNFYIVLTIGLLVVFGAVYNLIYTMYKELAQQNRKVQAINAMFQTTLQQTKNIPFAIDYTLNQLVLYGYPTKDVVQCCSFSDMLPESMIKKGILDPGSLTEYQKLYQYLIVQKEPCDPVIIYSQMGEKKEWIRVRITSDTQNNTEQMIGVLEDYGEQKEKDLQIENHLVDIKKIEKKSQIDFLTNLYNREAFIQKVNIALEVNARNHETAALLILDLDHFKEVNDCMGHGTGDIVLQQTANTLHSFFRKEDIVGRLGGDEFVIFAKNIRNIQAFERRINELNRLLCKIYQKNGKSIQISASIGIMLTDADHTTFTALYEKADQALYQVKAESRNGYRIYSEMERRP